MQRALSMRRLAAVAALSFVLVLAFLAGRVRAGADPTQATARAPQATPDAMSAPPAYGAPGDTVVPGYAPDNGPSGSFDPPATHAS